MTAVHTMTGVVMACASVEAQCGLIDTHHGHALCEDEGPGD